MGRDGGRRRKENSEMVKEKENKRKNEGRKEKKTKNLHVMGRWKEKSVGRKGMEGGRGLRRRVMGVS